MSTGAYVLQSAIAGEPITAGGLLGAAVGGGVGGLVGACVSRIAWSAANSWGALIGGGAASGAASGAATSLVQQFVDTGTIDGKQVAKSVLWGTIGGMIGGAALKGIGGKFGALDKSAMHCNLGAGRVGTLAGVNALAGGVGGGLADTVTQLGQWATGERSGFSFRQAFAATVAGAAGGAAGYMASRVLFKACFVKGTLILTPTGWRKIEELVEGDWVLSRDEHNPNGELVWRRVLQTFVRISPVLNLHVRGKVIGTTGEHPFYVLGKDWTAARELAIGDVLLSHDGQHVLVDGVADSGRIETVYNVEVEHDHTYFVGDDGTEWSVWAHNRECSFTQTELEELAKKYVENTKPLTPGGKSRRADYSEIIGAEHANKSKAQQKVDEKAIRHYVRSHPDLGGSVPKSKGGQGGNDEHKNTVRRLVTKARSEYPDSSEYKIHEGTSIAKKTGLDVHPDVWVEHIESGNVVKVYEAARLKSHGVFKDREVIKQAKYASLNPPIPAHLEPVW